MLFGRQTSGRYLGEVLRSRGWSPHERALGRGGQRAGWLRPSALGGWRKKSAICDADEALRELDLAGTIIADVQLPEL